VVLSNCVLNLVPDKSRAFAEIARVLRPGGWFTVSDIVIDGALPPALQNVAELYVGCVSGASAKQEYLAHIAAAGFVSTEIVTEKEIVIPQDLFEKLTASLPPAERRLGDARILSVTVRAKKPA
jgi:arsenite methyltransferase